MAKFLATRIVGEYLFYKDVPHSLQEPVKEELYKLGREDLTGEEEKGGA